MHTHDVDMPLLTFDVIIIGDSGTHLIEVESPCVCGMEEFVMALPDLPFLPTLIEVLPRRSSRLSYSR